MTVLRRREPPSATADRAAHALKCDVCAKPFGSARALGGHVLTHRPKGTPPKAPKSTK